MESSFLLLRSTIIIGAERVPGTDNSMRENYEGDSGSEPPSENETLSVEAVLEDNERVHPESDNPVEEILRTIYHNVPLAAVLNHQRGREGK